MNFWGRRIVVFLAVLSAGFLMAHIGGRDTAHASARVAVTPSTTRIAPISPFVAAAVATDESNRPSAPVHAGGAGTVSAANSGMAAPSSSAATSAGAGSAALVSGPGATRTFHDRSYKVSFDYPANWTFSDKDHEISTFRLDARSAEKKTQLRAVTAIPENPFPASTFTGAYVYLSVTPHSSRDKCAAQAAPPASARSNVSQIAGLKFAHGHDEQKQICTVERDEIYTTYRKGACYRFDLAINNFCGGEVSGVKDVTEQELDSVRERMESILGTVRFDPK